MPSSTHYAGWEASVLMGRETTYGTKVGGSLKAVPITAFPSPDAAPEFVDSGETGRGRAERFYAEFGVGRKNAGLQFQTSANETRMYEFLRSMFQANPTKTGTAPFKYEWLTYTAQPTTNLGLSFELALRQGGTAAALEMLGSIVKSTRLSSQGSDFVKADVALRGTTATQITASSTANVWDPEVVLMHRHGYCNVTPSGGSLVAVDSESLEVGLDNNLTAWYGNSQTPNALVMGVLGITGGFQISAKVGMGTGTFWTDLLTRNSVKIVIGWGTPAAAGNIEFTYDAVYEEGTFGNVDGVQALTFNHRQAKRVTATSAVVYATADLT